METKQSIIFTTMFVSLIFLNPILGSVEATTSVGEPILQVSSSVVCGNKLCSESNDTKDKKLEEKFRTLLHPKHQTKKGIPIDRVKCMDNFILIQKNSDGSPACVTLKSLVILLERGWGKEVLKPVNQTLN